MEEIKRLLERWSDAQTTDAEERELREWFRTAGELPAELEPVRRMFIGFDVLATEKVLPRVLRTKWSLVGQVAVWSAAAVIAGCIVFAAGYARRPYGYINGVPVRDVQVAMQTMNYLEQMDAFDRSAQTLNMGIETTEK